MDHKFTEKVQEWLDTPSNERDYDQGALFLLQLSNNQIVYRNISRNAKRNGDFIEHQIRKYMSFRLASLTHDQVADMQAVVDKIVAMRHLDGSESDNAEEPIAESADSASSDASAEGESESENKSSVISPSEGETTSSTISPSEFKSGKRPDHDSLPVEIQALYVENASIMQKMRELHLQLRKLSTAEATCPDSERYPFLKELIALDKQYHHNWQVYDSWSAERAAEGAEQQLIEDERMAQKNIYRRINLAKGRYKKNPSEALREQIRGLYAELVSPVESLTAELRDLGIIE